MQLDSGPLETALLEDVARRGIDDARAGNHLLDVEFLERVIDHRARGFGDFWQHCLVAEGALDLAAEPVVNAWDLAALLPIVVEAGGRFTDLTGAARHDGGTVLSSNGALHDAALAFLRP